MPFYELFWEDGKYKESDPKPSFSDLLKQRTHFYNYKKVAFCMLSVPGEELKKAEDGYGTIIGVKNDLFGFFRQGNEYNYLDIEGWAPGYCDLSYAYELRDVIREIVFRLGYPPFSLNRRTAEVLSRGIGELPSTELYTTIDDQLQNNLPEPPPCHVFLFVIKSNCYDQIQSSTVKLPDMIAGVFKYEYDGQFNTRELERIFGLAIDYVKFSEYFNNMSFEAFLREKAPDLIVPDSIMDDFIKKILPLLSVAEQHNPEHNPDPKERTR